MRMLHSTYILRAAVLAAVCGASVALAEPPDGARPPHHGPHGAPPILRELRELDLTDSQRSQIKPLLESARETMRGNAGNLHKTRLQFEQQVPGSPAYASATSALADAEADFARVRVQKEAELRTQIYAVLTDQQKQKLLSLAADAPSPEAAPE